MITSSRYLMNGSPTRCTFCNGPFHPCNGFWFGGRLTATTSVQSFAQTTARRLTFESAMPPRSVAAHSITHPRPLSRIADLGCRHSPFGWHQPGVPQR